MIKDGTIVKSKRNGDIFLIKSFPITIWDGERMVDTGRRSIFVWSEKRQLERGLSYNPADFELEAVSNK